MDVFRVANKTFAAIAGIGAVCSGLAFAMCVVGGGSDVVTTCLSGFTAAANATMCVALWSRK